MSNAEKITIQEWASENSIQLSEEQVADLQHGLEMAREMDSYGTGWTPGHRAETEEDREIKRLQKTIKQLEGFANLKGFSVSADENGITHFWMERTGFGQASARQRYSF
jgi:hypothetical protein